jgi:hypothetical protein
MSTWSEQCRASFRAFALTRPMTIEERDGSPAFLNASEIAGGMMIRGMGSASAFPLALDHSGRCRIPLRAHVACPGASASLFGRERVLTQAGKP